MGASLPRKEAQYVLQTLQRYWPRGSQVMLELPIPSLPVPQAELHPPQLSEVQLPDWAADLGVQGQLLVPRQSIAPGERPTWQRVDWLTAIFWYLNGLPERAYEAQRGPIHSYAFRLKCWDLRMWDHAWVNRMALFLRRWAARSRQTDEQILMGPVPEANVIVTHDLDAVQKTVAIRVKQSAFHAFNAARMLRARRPHDACHKIRQATRFLFRAGNYNQLDTVATLEQARGVRGHINVYGGPACWRGSPKQLLFDPAYDVRSATLRNQLKGLVDAGWRVGLHPSFDAWGSSARIKRERQCLETALGQPVDSCRQHWLRFSWERTWHAQQAAGLRLDTTLGFNDRPGFRNGAALRFRPWDLASGRPLEIEAIPLVLMDSHLYDYSPLTAEAREREIHRWIQEICAIRGEATVLWHPHTLSNDYGWRNGFETLLKAVDRG